MTRPRRRCKRLARWSCCAACCCGSSRLRLGGVIFRVPGGETGPCEANRFRGLVDGTIPNDVSYNPPSLGDCAYSEPTVIVVLNYVPAQAHPWWKQYRTLAWLPAVWYAQHRFNEEDTSSGEDDASGVTGFTGFLHKHLHDHHAVCTSFLCESRRSGAPSPHAFQTLGLLNSES